MVEASLHRWTEAFKGYVQGETTRSVLLSNPPSDLEELWDSMLPIQTGVTTCRVTFHGELEQRTRMPILPWEIIVSSKPLNTRPSQDLCLE